jgi:hypothetical protein
MRKSSGRKPRVAVLTTGVMELAALHLALSRRFPQAEFVPQAAAAGRPYDSFTSGALPAPLAKAHTAAVRIAQAAAQLADDASVHQVLILEFTLRFPPSFLSNADQSVSNGPVSMGSPGSQILGSSMIL